jgi:hypothetical protein
MAGLVPAIHGSGWIREGVDGRDKPDHDGGVAESGLPVNPRRAKSDAAFQAFLNQSRSGLLRR